MKVAAVLAFCVAASWGTAADAGRDLAHVFSADLFELKSQRQKKIYTLQIHEELQGERTSTEATYSDLKGGVAVIERGVREGARLIRLEVDQKQTGEKGLVEARDGRVYFTHTQADGKVKTADEKLGATLVAPANFGAFVKEHYADLKSGKAVEFRFAVWFRRETVGFELKKMNEETYQGTPAIRLKMKPSSFLIAALVDPLEFVFDLEGHRLLLMKGRVPPKQGPPWKDLDAEVVYQ